MSKETIKGMTPAQILGICADIASSLEGAGVTLEEAQRALKNPSCRRNFVTVLKNGGNLPASNFGKLELIKPLERGSLVGYEFLEKARAIARKKGCRTLGQAEYDFYGKPENWHLLPDPSSGIDFIVFVEAQFDYHCGGRMRYLLRKGSKWDKTFDSLGLSFVGFHWVAVSPVGA